MNGVTDDARSPESANRIARLGCRGLVLLGLILAGCAGGRGLQPVPTMRAQKPESPGFFDDLDDGERPSEAGRLPRPLSGLAGSAGRPDEPAAVFPGPNEPVADVRVEGNTTIPTAEVLRQLKTRAGRPATEQQVREDVRSLWATRWFFSVEPVYRRTDQGLVVVFRVLERPIVQRVQYLGHKKIKEKELANHTGLKRGSPYDPAANREAARRLEALYHEKGYTFATVELERGELRDDREVVFRIHEGPKVRVDSVRFTGNKELSDSLLKMKLQTSKAILWYFGGKYDPATIPDDVASLKQYYHSLGYFDVKIDHEVSYSKSQAYVRIEYLIDEGVRYKVRNIEIQGNEIFNESDFRKDFKLTEGGHFNARHLARDVAGIKDKYGELGHLFAQVDAIPRFLDTPGEADLVYHIDEDQAYRIRMINVNINGDSSYTRRGVPLNYSRINPGDLADPKKIKATERFLGGTQLFEMGPLDGPKIRISRVESELDGLDVYRGQAADFDEVADEMAGWVQPFRVARQPSIYLQPQAAADEAEDDEEHDLSAESIVPPAEPIVPPAEPIVQPAESIVPPLEPIVRPAGQPVIRGQSAFEGPIPQPQNPMFMPNPQGDPFGNALAEPQPPPFVDLDIDVVEGRTGRLMFGVGINSDAGAVGSVVLTEDNFDLFRPPTSWQDIVEGRAWRGGGQRFRAEAVPGHIVSRYLVSWTDPFFLDTDYSFGLSGFFFNRFFFDWDERRAGGRVSVGRQLTPFLSVTGSLRAEEVVISRPRMPTPPMLQEAVGSSLVSTARGTVAYDTRDSPFMPGEGYYVSASYEQGFGEFTYPRVELDGNQYFTIFSRPDGGGRHILALTGQLGWTGGDTPIFERFFAGGFQTFRGFEFRGVGPREFAVNVGGQWLALGSVEYMFPLLANEMLQAVVFSDFGTVERDIRFDEFRASVGAGLRVTVPALGPAPLAFDFAFPVLKQPGDDVRVFSFFVGMTR